MMTPRRFTLLAIAGLAVIALALWVSSQRHLERTLVLGQPVLPSLKSALNAVTEVRMVRGDGTRASLRKGADTWMVAERDFPADFGRVRKLLLDLADLQIVEEKTRDPANYPQIGVEDVTSPKAGGTRVEILSPGKTLSLIVGKPSGMKSVYARVGGEPQSVLATPQPSTDADPRHWLERSVIDLPQERIKEVSVQPHGAPAYVVTRTSAQQADFTVPNLPKGRELVSSGAANPQAGGLASLELDDVHKAAAVPADADHATFTTFNGLTVDVTGHKDGDRRLITLNAQSSAKETADEAQRLNTRFGGWEIEIPSYKYDGLFKPLEDLLKKPEEPKKAAAKGAKKGAAGSNKTGAGAPEQSPAK